MRWTLLCAGLLGAGLACAGGVPAPPFATPFDRVPPDSIRQYLKDLEFDHREGAGDVQPLVLGCPQSCRIGPVVGVFPERRIHQNKNSSLAEGPGRIIAQIINYDAVQSYPRLNLGPGDTVYWAVDSVSAVNRELSRGRSLFISSQRMRTGQDPVLKRPLRIDEHPDAKPLSTAIARWVFDSTNYSERDAPGGQGETERWRWEPMTWANCKSVGCCR